MNDSLFFPAEWARHECVWTAWPSDAALWEENLEPARAEVAAMIRAIVGAEGAPDAREPVRLLYRGEEAQAAAQEMLRGLFDTPLLDLISAPIGDIWLRDTGPLFRRRNGVVSAATFAFNGWGGKYRLPEDDSIGRLVAERAGVSHEAFDIVLEGGAIDSDGAGTILTTRQCLLNPNRNPGKNEGDLEAVLRAALGVEKVIWLDEGLVNDHTDGHVDNIARFVGPGKVVCMRPLGKDDPNAAVYDSVRRSLEAARDAMGRPLEILEIPSPGLIADENGAPVPASHINFYIANGAVVMPDYADSDEGRDGAAEALAVLAQHIERPRHVALPARRLLTGGGSFHCITQQQPETRKG